MIIIAGTPAFSEPPGLAGLGFTARRVWEAKLRSPFEYRYASVEDLIFELNAREKIVEAGVSMARSGAVFDTFARSKANPAFWIRLPNGGFQLRQGVEPAAAINDIFANGNLYVFECAMAVVMVLYKGFLGVIGREAFNRLFSNLYLYSWEHDRDLFLITDERAAEKFPADIVYFDNPDHLPAHPEFQGENAIILDETHYFAHGLGVTTGERIIRALNRQRRPWSQRSAYLMDQVTYPDYARVRRRALIRQADIEELQPEPVANRITARIGSRTRIV